MPIIDCKFISADIALKATFCPSDNRYLTNCHISEWVVLKIGCHWLDSRLQIILALSACGCRHPAWERVKCYDARAFYRKKT